MSSRVPDTRPDPVTAQLEAELRDVLVEVLGRAAAGLDPQQPISLLGLDSLMAVELQHRLESELGLVVSMADILQDVTLAQLVAQGRAHAGPAAAAPQQAPGFAAAEPAAYPLSHGQQALWFLQQLDPAGAAYQIAAAVRIRGTLDIPALRRALQMLVDQHAALRTTFDAAEGEPRQRVHPRQPVALDELDARDWSAEALGEHLAAEAQRGFDLARGPLLRFTLLARGDQDHVLALVAHHLIADFWSLALLARQLDALYAAAQAGHPVPLDPPTAQYSDYVRWQTGLLAGSEGERLWQYWRAQLDGAPTVLDLPTDRPRPAAQTSRGSTARLLLHAGLTQRLKALGAAHGLTPYMTLVGALAIVLSRASEQTDLLLGATTTGRSRAALAPIVGYIVNPVVLRLRLIGNSTVEALLSQVRERVLGALAHQDYPFAQLVERLQPARDPSRPPLVQVMTNWQQAPPHVPDSMAALALGIPGVALELGALNLETVALEQRTAQFDLALMAAEIDGRLALTLQYNRDLFDATTITRMLGQIQTVLEGIARQPDQRLAQVPLLSRAERQQLLVEWNNTASGDREQGTGDGSIHELFEAQAARTPDAVAVVFDASTNDQRPTTNDQQLPTADCT